MNTYRYTITVPGYGTISGIVHAEDIESATSITSELCNATDTLVVERAQS